MKHSKFSIDNSILFCFCVFAHASPLTWNTLLSHLHILTPSTSNAIASSYTVCSHPLCTHENTPQISAITWMVLICRPWLPSVFHVLVRRPYCPWAVPNQWSNVTGILRPGPFLASRQLWCGFWPENPKGQAKTSLGCTHFHPFSVPPSCVQSWACMVAC